MPDRVGKRCPECDANRLGLLPEIYDCSTCDGSGLVSNQTQQNPVGLTAAPSPVVDRAVLDEAAQKMFLAQDVTHIESALLDRIEDKLADKDGVSPDSYVAVLELLTEIRQGLDPAQSPEAGK